MKKGLYVCICIGMMLFIWHNSLQDAVRSDAASLYLASAVRPFLIKWGSHISLSLLDDMVRKCAHVVEFFLLGCAVYGTCSGIPLLRSRRFIWVVGIGVAIASVDEFLQLFSPGRGARLQDVGIDGCGVLIGYLMGRIYSYITKG